MYFPVLIFPVVIFPVLIFVSHPPLTSSSITGPGISPTAIYAWGNTVPVLASHMRMMELPSDREMILDPSGENSAEAIGLSWA